MVDRMQHETFDLLVVGGGITGCGVALEAAARGLRVALVERHDFASGTSSKSSKLVHGGLRYLQQGDVRLVYQALHERQRLLHNAPHLVRVLPFLIPIMNKDGVVSEKVAKALRSALWMYDRTGGARIGKLHKKLDAERAHAHCPTLPAMRVSGGFVYYDAAADDARLTLTIARTAAAHGAVVANQCEVVGFTKNESGRTDGALVRAEPDSEPFRVRASVVVSAAGVWADDVRQLDEGTHPDSMRPAKGVHITIPWSLVRNDIAVIISALGDKRSLFLIPWGELPDGTFEHCYVGTTDTDHGGGLDEPHVEPADVNYVLLALNAALTTTITQADITAVWAGLRPLVKDASSARTADLSRRHSVTTSASGVVSVTGGKLTTYREMASDAVNVAVAALGRTGRGDRRSRTKRLELLGAAGFRRPDRNDPGARLLGRYGTLAHEVSALIEADPPLGEPLVPGLRYVGAEAVYAVRHEMARTLTDVLTRRTRAHLEDRAACVAAAPHVARLIAPELGWSEREIEAQIAEYRSFAAREIDASTPS